MREATVVTSAADARKLGRYVLVGELGEGGMGRVYLARATGHGGFEKLVAVKVMSPGLAERHPEMAEMFIDEARIGALLRHPNICSVLDFGEAQGVRFLVMEYLEGQSLLAILKRLANRPDVRTDSRFPLYAARIVAEACEGLHGAHTAVDPTGRPLRIVHRDISPENLFVTYDGAIKVMDFGIARARSRSYETSDGSFKGKIAYAAPEALENAALDPSTDVWGAGVVLWELLTGEPLFLRDNEAGTVGAVLVEAIHPPSRVNPLVPGELDAIVMRALERDRNYRHRSARDLARELNRFAAASGEHVGTAELALFIAELFPAERQVQDEVTRVARGIASAARGAKELEAAEASRSLVASEVRPSGVTPAPVRSGASGRQEVLLPIQDLGSHALPRVSTIHVEPTMVTPMERPTGGRRSAGSAAPASASAASGRGAASASRTGAASSGASANAGAASNRSSAGASGGASANAAKASGSGGSAASAARAGAASTGASAAKASGAGARAAAASSASSPHGAAASGNAAKPSASAQASVAQPAAAAGPPATPPTQPRRSLMNVLVPVLIGLTAIVTGIWLAQISAPPAPAAPPASTVPAPVVDETAEEVVGPARERVDPTVEPDRDGEPTIARDDDAPDPTVDPDAREAAEATSRTTTHRSGSSTRASNREARTTRTTRQTRTTGTTRTTSMREPRETRTTRRQTTPPIAPTGATGTVNVFAVGSWADIYEGDRLLGRTPARLRLPVGRHVLTLRPPSGPSVRRTVNVTADGRTNLRVEL